MEVVTFETGPFDSRDRLPNVPAEIPVLTILPDGRRLSGIPGPPLTPAGTRRIPDSIWFSDSGYELNVVRQIRQSCFFSSARREEDERLHDAAASPSIVRTVPVLPRPTTLSGEQRGGGLDIVYMPNESTYPAEHLASIRAALTRVETRLESLLNMEPGFCRIAFGFGLAVPLGFAADTVVNCADETYQFTKQNLFVFAGADNEPNQEILMYEQLPPGSSLPVKFTGLGQRAVETICVALALRNKWNRPAAAVPEATTVARSNAVWDFDIEDGIDAGALDFEKIMTHEAIHAIGFASGPEGGDGFGTFLTTWELFRLDRAAVGPSATLFHIRNLVRMLDATVEAVEVVATGTADGIPRVSRGTAPGGGGRQAGHWKDVTLLRHEDPQATPIGIMDPLAGGPEGIPGYLTLADRRAIDLIGWGINSSGGPQAPGGNVPQQPPDGQDRVPYSPTLSWTPGGGSTRQNVIVYRGTSVVSANKVFDQRNVVGNSITIPAGILGAGESYLWFTTSLNNFAYTYSAHRTFTTLPACPGDADGDRDRDFADINSVLTNFGATYQPAPPGVFPGDANGDGTVNFADATAVLEVFGISCP